MHSAESTAHKKGMALYAPSLLTEGALVQELDEGRHRLLSDA